MVLDTPSNAKSWGIGTVFPFIRPKFWNFPNEGKKRGNFPKFSKFSVNFQNAKMLGAFNWNGPKISCKNLSRIWVFLSRLLAKNFFKMLLHSTLKVSGKKSAFRSNVERPFFPTPRSWPRGFNTRVCSRVRHLRPRHHHRSIKSKHD